MSWFRSSRPRLTGRHWLIAGLLAGLFAITVFWFITMRLILSPVRVLRDTAARGHTIALHSWSHKRLDRIGSAASSTGER